MFCTNCGSKLLEGAKFCSNCGTKLEVKDLFDENKDIKEEVNDIEESVKDNNDLGNDEELVDDTLNDNSNSLDMNDYVAVPLSVNGVATKTTSSSNKRTNITLGVISLVFASVALITSLYYIVRDLYYYSINDIYYILKSSGLRGIPFAIPAFIVSIIGLVGYIKNKHVLGIIFSGNCPSSNFFVSMKFEANYSNKQGILKYIIFKIKIQNI